MELSEEVQGVIESIEEVQEDTALPKNVKDKLTEVIAILRANSEEESMRVSKALDKVEEIVDDANLQSYTRTQIWNLASILEAL